MDDDALAIIGEELAGIRATLASLAETIARLERLARIEDARATAEREGFALRAGTALAGVVLAGLLLALARVLGGA